MNDVLTDDEKKADMIMVGITHLRKLNAERNSPDWNPLRDWELPPAYHDAMELLEKYHAALVDIADDYTEGGARQIARIALLEEK